MTNKKDNKKKTSQDEKNKKEESGFSSGKIIFVSAICAALCSYYLYKRLTTPPDPPVLDFNEYWGPYPMKMDPDLSIRPYEIEFSEVMVNDLRERLLHRRPFQPPLENSGFTYGFNSHFLTRVLDYWQNKYNFKERERFFNKYNHYVTNIQGLDVHYMHVKPQVPDDIEVVPLLLLHGWPGSVREFYELIPKLTSPRDDYKFAFEIIAPSLPGFGFSQAPSRPGFGPVEMSVVLSNLMKRIGHNKYYIQGGDFGHMLGSILATLMPEQVLGFHTNMPVLMFHPLANIYMMLGSLWPSLLVEPEQQSRVYPYSQYLMRIIEESGYLHIQATKPDTVGIALTDSPAGLAAYILEKFSTWTNNEYKVAGDGNLLQKFSLTHLLDNIMVYWTSNSITTSMRTYAETMNRRFLCMNIDMIPTAVPTWGIKFKHELAFSADAVLRLKYTRYLQSTVVEDGGHFAALEHPDILAADVFRAVEHFRLSRAGGKPQETSPVKEPQTIYDFTVRDIHGREIKLDKYRGKVVVIVNVASQCGLTDTNYHQLNELHDKYARSRDLRILAFPCNQFGGQEPGTAKDIAKFISDRNVKFDVFEKVAVNGDDAHPLFQFLKRVQRGSFGDYIKWNYSKFIVDRNGVPVERFGPHVDPIDLEPSLAKYW
ncbi:juvenile hormone epoxide hydrolase-like isoform X2 [Danaus plexippus]|uniref:juvenile hormone epoxide hydrolase-like isoform X2 n=1 Tax=Danaus plexippus TaxID=13037 RepID=UPI002AB208F7|nr:juvenile hormone epoxide hydrolase-like isoform X2 [Danaus plexippus]